MVHSRERCARSGHTGIANAERWSSRLADLTTIYERISAMRRALAVFIAVAGAGLLPSSVGALDRHETACLSSAVHYRTVKQPPRGVAGVPWIASTKSAFRGYLFYWGGTRWGHTRASRVQIFTTKAHVNINPKVLWVARRRHSGATLTIRGKRLDGSGSFSAHYPAAIGGGQFPSYVNIPTAGCWRVAVRSGSLQGWVTFRATDKP